MKIKIIGKNLLELRKEYGIGNGGFYDNPWWLDEPFAKERPEPGVYEINIEEKTLTNLTYDEQKKKLKKGYDFPHPAVLAEALITHYKETGEYLMEHWYSRTSLLVSDGHRVHVGYCGAGGVDVYGRWDDRRYDDVGVGASRKLSSIAPRSLETFDFPSLEYRIKSLEEWRERITKS